MIMCLKFRKAVDRIFTVPTALTLALVTFVFNNSAVAQIKLPLVPPQAPPVVPEANTGLVLIPIVIAVMFVASLQLFRKRAVQKQ
jgi:hypothetical protein